MGRQTGSSEVELTVGANSIGVADSGRVVDAFTTAATKVGEESAIGFALD